MSEKKGKSEKKPKLKEARVNSSDVHLIRKGLVSASDVARARKEIEQAKATRKDKQK